MNLREIDRLVAEKVMGWILLENNPDKLPRYSEDIAAAWNVVEKLKMYEPELSWSDETHSWWFVFHKLPHRIQSQDTASLAICLAALKANGIEVPQ